MKIHTAHALFLSVALAGGFACGDDDATPTDAGPSGDSGMMRDAARDSGGTDAGPGEDAGDVDAGPTDAGTDAGPALPTAVADIAESEGGTGITGTVTFIQDGTDVTVMYEVTNCPEGEHPTHIHAGTGCGNRGEQGMHWDPPRGENIPNLVCDAAGNGTLVYTRDGTAAALAWTIGDGAASDIVGLPVVIHGEEPTTDPRIGCGVITLR
jgi:Cu/Zn superoxide dismutase